LSSRKTAVWASALMALFESIGARWRYRAEFVVMLAMRSREGLAVGWS
jgi:hypothetical protein